MQKIKVIKSIITPERILLLILLLSGAYLRLYRISEYMTFLGDEGRDVLVVKRIIVDHKLTLLGPTASVGGFFLGPVYYYFMVPFLWLFRLDPTGPAVMVALFGIATVYLVYRLGKDFFHPWVGFAAASIYATSPLVIAYSRSSWNPNLVPFFSALLFYLLVQTVLNKKWINLFWIGMIIGIGLQLHYLFLFLIPITIIWFLVFGRSKFPLKYYIFGLGGFLLGYASFLAFELRHGFPNTQTIYRFLLEGKDTGFVISQFIKNVTELPLRMFGRLLFRLPPAEQWNNFTKEYITILLFLINSVLYLSISLSVLLLLSQKVWAARIIKKIQFSASILTERSRNALILLILWFFLVLFLFGFYKRAVYDYYFGIVFFQPFLFFGIFVWWISTYKLGKWLAMGLLSALVVFNWSGRPFLYEPNNQLGQMKEIASAVFSKTQGKPFNFALVTDQNSDHAYKYFFEIWGNPPLTIENTINDPERKTVTEQLFVVCEKTDCQPLGHPLWEIAGFGRAEIVGEWGISVVKIFKLVHYNEG